MEEHYSILCASCRKRLFVYRGDFKGHMTPNQFTPVGNTPAPARGEAMVCCFCTKPWYMINASTGGMLVLTNKGVKPRDPKLTEGQRERMAAPPCTPETPPEFRGSAPDFTDVTHRG